MATLPPGGPPRHRFFVPPDGVADGRVRFSAEQARQLGLVLRLRPGDCVRVFDGARAVDRLVELERLGDRVAEGRLVGELAQRPEPRLQLLACPALVPRDKLEQVLQKLVEVGVSAVAPVRTARCLVRHAPDAPREARWQAIIREAAEQSGRGIVPPLLPTLSLEDWLRRAVAEGPTLLAYEDEQTTTLRQAVDGLASAHATRVALFVGPEGGYAPEEVAMARALGAGVVSLGPRILRTETASPVFAALVLYALGDL